MCPIHEDRPHFVSNEEVDDDWRDRVEALKTRVEAGKGDIPQIPLLDAHVECSGGELWVHSWDLYHEGFRHRLKEFELIQIGAKVYEILSYAYDLRQYHVREFDTTLSEDDLQRLLEPA